MPRRMVGFTSISPPTAHFGINVTTTHIERSNAGSPQRIVVDSLKSLAELWRTSGHFETAPERRHPVEDELYLQSIIAS
jgi:hypothetical protein